MKPPYDLNRIALLFVGFVAISLWWAHNGKRPLERSTMLELLYLGLGGIALVLTIYDRQDSIARDIETKKRTLAMDEQANQKDNFLQPIQTIVSNFPESADMFYEMFRVNRKPAAGLKIDETKQKMVEQSISLQIFQIVENFIFNSTEMSEDIKREWLARMLFWFRSNTLQQYYKYTKFMYNPQTNALIDRLIGISNEINSTIKTDSDLTLDVMMSYVEKIY